MQKKKHQQVNQQLKVKQPPVKIEKEFADWLVAARTSFKDQNQQQEEQQEHHQTNNKNTFKRQNSDE